LEKKEIYKRIRIAGLISFIPIILFTGPFAGYVVGDYLVKNFRLPFYVMVLCIAIGCVAGISETVRIIKITLLIEENG
jgi:hypothetical protein